jgi:hypothetical protein
MFLPEFDLSFPHVSSSFIYHPATQRPGPESSQVKLIYFITGNPGLIAYYGPFLSTLYSLLSQAHKPSSDIARSRSKSSPSPRFAILGTSLTNFAPSCMVPESHSPLSLADQISLSNLRLETFCGRLQIQESTTFPIQVYLIGHSVGSYISLSISSACHPSHDPDHLPKYRVFNTEAAILLTPTIADIALSQSGRVFTPLSTLPGFAGGVGMLVGILTALLPVSFVAWIIRRVMQLPEHIAVPTAGLVRNWGRGVREAL